MALALIDACIPEVPKGRRVTTLTVAPIPPEEISARPVLNTSRICTPSDDKFEKSNALPEAPEALPLLPAPTIGTFAVGMVRPLSVT